jgi:4-carboxymuconolactone decarboxylase
MRLATPRIPPLPPELWDDATRADLAMLAGGANAERVLNIFQTLAHHPKLAKRWMVFANHVLAKNSLPARERELVILRIGWLCRSEYEWAQHVVIGAREGLGEDEILRIAAGPDAPGWSEADRALLRATDELAHDAFVSDPTWRALAGFLSTPQLMDLVFTVGEYALVSMALNTFGVPLDPGLPRMPSADDVAGGALAWSAFAAQSAELAAAGERLLSGVAYLATVRADGSARVAPVCPIFARGELYLSVVTESPKRCDLARDGRFALHAALGHDDEEFQVSGRAAQVVDAEELAAVHAAIRFTYDASHPVFRLRVASALHARWDAPGTPAMRCVRERWYVD